MRNAHTHAKDVLYAIENNPHFHEPDSFLIAMIVAMHGKLNRIKIM